MNEVEVHNNIHKIKDREKKKKKPKFKVGDQVRVSRVKGTFEKGYDTKFSYLKSLGYWTSDISTYRLWWVNWWIILLKWIIETNVPDHNEIEKY